MPDPIKMLKTQHDEVKALFKEFESADGRSKPRIAREVIQMLTIHDEIEEKIFYPAFEKASGEEGLVAEAEQEHDVVKTLIAELQKMDRGSDEVHFDAKFTVMAENVEHHIEEEETEMLPEAQKVMKDQLEELGAKMEKLAAEMKKELSAPAR